MKAKLLILTGVIFLLAISGFAWIVVSGWPPIIIRNSEYRKLISDFHQAQLREKSSRDSNISWDFHIQIPERQINVRIWAAYSGGVVWLKDMDGEPDRPLYEYVDYTHATEIRTAENILYVHWVETLFRTDHWLMAYDLSNRREIVRRKIDPADLE